MAGVYDDPTGNGDGDSRRRVAVDARLSSAGREGLTGTTAANIYKAAPDPDQVTIAPDGRPADEQPAWRQDFPIDWPQDHYVARRDFAKFMVLTSLAFAVGQMWIGVQNWWRRRRGQPPVARIVPLAQVPPGTVMTFNYPEHDDTCVLIHTTGGQLLAYSQKCTHLSCAVVPRLDPSAPGGGAIHCPCHEGYFDLQEGRPLAGPPRRPLPRIRLERRGGDLYATGVEWRAV
jgi:Rieske Fe-S protein